MAQSLDDKLNFALQAADMPVEQFALLAAAANIPRASKARIYESFRGGKQLDAETAEKLWRLWCRVQALLDRLAPIPVSLKSAATVKTLLDLVEKERLAIIISAVDDK
jgi:hypothetical protein